MTEGDHPTQIGPYRVLEPLGQGGMGTVYKAEQREPVRRLVALKVVQQGMATKDVLARFALERRALAAMNHRCIAKVFDAGATDGGQPYFVMELVEGLPITEYCDKHKLSLPERLKLFQQVCSGVQHAHLKGVIHRDLKPGNVLVTREGDDAVPKILDFGLAKATNRDFLEATLFTEKDQILGTPEYMSPEQATGDGEVIDARTDIYSLGVMLYELLTGELPFPTAQLRKAGVLEALRLIRETEPPKPSTRLTTSLDLAAATAGRRRMSTGALSKALRGDLDWIVMQALAKEPERRYESANAVGMELQRFLDHEPVLAGPPSLGYRARKFGRKYRGQLVAAGLVMMAIAVGGAVAAYLAVENAALAESESEQRGKAEQLAASEAAQRRTAQSNLDRFNQLRNVVLLEKAKLVEEDLYPAWPEKLDAMRAWIAEHGVPLRKALPKLEQAREEVAARAVPQTDAEREAERASHPKFVEWQALRAVLAERERAAAVRAGDAEPVAAELEAATQALDAAELNSFAWPRVAPEARDRKVPGEVARGLAAARLAVEKAADGPVGGRASYTNTLAWALFASGLDADARVASQRALELAPADRREEYAGYVASLDTAIATAGGAAAQTQLTEIRSRIAALEAEVTARQTWSFPTSEDEFLHTTLVELCADLRTFESESLSAVEQREDWASRIGSLTLGHPNARVTWAAARDAILAADGVTACELYRSDPPYDLPPQCGLVPIGMNPATKLWEFYHLRSAWDPAGGPPPDALTIPTHREDGSIEVTDETGIVFVLVPGGTDWLGAQSTDPEGTNFDPAAQPRESPYEITLSPYFLARHELTQGQYVRLTGEANPSSYGPGLNLPAAMRSVVDLSHPVEEVDWAMSNRSMVRHGLALPTEAQWEYACRAGASTPWWTGAERESLIADGVAANLADQAATRGGATWTAIRDWPELDDGWVIHARADALRASPWGFHHIHGNIWEWCRDWFGDYSTTTPRAGDGLRTPTGSSGRVNRGGCFNLTAAYARSAIRSGFAPAFRSFNLGLRPSRASRLDDFTTSPPR